VHEIAGIPQKVEGPLKRVDMGSTEPPTLRGSGALDSELSQANKAVQDAIAEAEHAANPGHGTRPADGLPGTADDEAPGAPPAQ
jgi:hypothetical protein